MKKLTLAIRCLIERYAPHVCPIRRNCEMVSTTDYLKFLKPSLGLFFYILLLYPISSNAQIMFSEIAWMGTDVSANDEWIELYNLGETPVDLTGWTVTSNDGKISITLICTLAPHGVAVLERTDDSTLPDVTALLTYTGDLVNGGATLIIRNPNGSISDEVEGGTGWGNIGGNNTSPKQTPQRTRTGTWVTAPPTPNGMSAAGDAGTSNVSCPTVEEETDVDVDVEEEETVQTVTPKAVVKSSGGSSKKTPDVAAKLPGVLSLRVQGPKIAYVNQEVSFEVMPEGIGPTLTRSLIYTWNFGDTYTASGKTSTHVFKYPGEYIVMVGGEYAKASAFSRHEVIVLPVSFALSYTESGDVRIQNNAPQEVDLGGFRLGGSGSFTFPKFTMLKPKGVLTISKDRAHVSGRDLSLFDTQGALVVSTAPVVPTLASIPQYTRPSAPLVSRTTTVAKAPVTELEKNEDEQKLVQADTYTEESPQTIIQIGSVAGPEPEGGFFTRLVRKISSIFD